MAKLKWKKGLINLCTPLLKRHVVKGYIHGELGVYKVPGSKPTQWSITHITTGMNCLTGVWIAFMKMVEVKEFASKLLASDTWYIEGAEWGDLSQVSDARIASVCEVLASTLEAEGYKVDTRKYDPADKEVVLHMCTDCGKIAKRYILAIGDKWKHKCLDCEPYTKEEEDNER